MATLSQALSIASDTAYAEGRIHLRHHRLIKRHLRDEAFLEKAKTYLVEEYAAQHPDEPKALNANGDFEDWADIMLFLVSLVGTLIRLFLIFV